MEQQLNELLQVPEIAGHLERHRLAKEHARTTRLAEIAGERAEIERRRDSELPAAIAAVDSAKSRQAEVREQLISANQALDAALGVRDSLIARAQTRLDLLELERRSL